MQCFRTAVTSLFVFTSLMSAPCFSQGPSGEETEADIPPERPQLVPDLQSAREAYEDLLKHRTGLVKKGIPPKALDRALKYWGGNLKVIGNPRFLTIVDYSAHSGTKRMFIVETATGQLTRLHVAHGKGSDPKNTGRAQSYSNVNGSLATSKGFLLVNESYNGGKGLALRMDGLEEHNSNARPRAIVIHGADYVRPDLPQMGRSHGCPAVSHADMPMVAAALEGGSLFYAYDGAQ